MSFSSRVTNRPSFFSLRAPSKLLSLILSSTFSRFDGSWSHNLHPLLSGLRLSLTFLRFDASWLHILNPSLPGVRLSSTFSRFDASWSHNPHTSWFVKVKEFVLQMQNQTKTLDLLFFPGEKLHNTFDRGEASRRCRSPPYALKCLSLELHSSKILDYAALMEGHFWSFCPEILLVSCTYLQEGRDGCLLEFLCKMFEGREDDDDGASKCWWQWSTLEVKEIIVKDSKGIKQEVTLSWDALSKAIQIIQKIGQPKRSVNFI